jgi:hypothetical protein
MGIPIKFVAAEAGFLPFEPPTFFADILNACVGGCGVCVFAPVMPLIRVNGPIHCLTLNSSIAHSLAQVKCNKHFHIFSGT